MVDIVAPDIPGSDEIVSWFGCWPSFHDAEILELHLDRADASWIKVHAWTSGMVNGNYKSDHHAIITFTFERVRNLDLSDFSPQNVIFGLDVEKSGDCFRVTLSPCYGMAGFIESDRIRVGVEPIDRRTIERLKSHFLIQENKTADVTSESGER